MKAEACFEKPFAQVAFTTTNEFCHQVQLTLWEI